MRIINNRMSQITRTIAGYSFKCASFYLKNSLCRPKPVCYNLPICRSFGTFDLDARSNFCLPFSISQSKKPNALCHVPSIKFAPSLTFVRSAGHSHWHNIRHIKESKDALKQKASQDVVRKIKMAAREGGSVNPKLNSRLARVLEEGKAKDVSNVTMMEVLKRLEKGKDMKGTPVFIEAMGIGNCMVIVETYTDRPKWIRQEVQHVMKQYGGRIGEAGSSAHSFNFKGIVYLVKDQEKPLSEDEAFEVAIEVGAEDVMQGLNDHGQDTYQLICDPKQLHAVKTALEGRGFKPDAARLEFIPHIFTKLDEASLAVASRMLDGLEAVEEVVRVYDNIES